MVGDPQRDATIIEEGGLGTPKAQHYHCYRTITAYVPRTLPKITANLQGCRCLEGNPYSA